MADTIAGLSEGSRAWTWRLGALFSVAAVALVVSDALPWLRGPAPYPPEWQWERASRGAPAVRRALVPFALPAAALIGLLAASGGAWARRRPERAGRVLLAAATLIGPALALAVLIPEPGGALRTLMRRTLSRTVTSYLTVAASPDAADPRLFLDRHAELLPVFRRTAKHAATHPPGPVLFHRAALALTRAWPGLTRGLLAAAGADPDRGRLEAPTRAAALLAPMAIVLAGSLTAWPIAALARTAGAAPLGGARIGALWAFIPGPALMTPQFDQLLALPVAGAGALLARSVSGDGARWGSALAAGLAGGLALQVSYGAAVFLAVTGLAALAAAAPGLRRVAPAVLAALAAAAAVVLAPMAWGHEPLAAARTALAIHREVYTAPRSYALWLAFNPIDLAVFLGLPVAALLAVAVWRSARRGAAFLPLTAADRLRLVSLAGLALLTLSGTVRGEVGRIWIPLLPVLLAGALTAPEGEGPTAAEAAALAAGLAAVTFGIGSAWVVG